MDVSDQFQQIRIFLAQDRFIAILKQMSAPAVAAIETNRVSGQKPPHYRAKRRAAGSGEDMEMIGNKRPSIAGCFCFRQDVAEAVDKIVPVLVVYKYPPPFYPTTNDVVQRSWSVYS